MLCVHRVPLCLHFLLTTYQPTVSVSDFIFTKTAGKFLMCENLLFNKCSSIHPSSSALSGPGRGGSCLSRDTQTSLTPDTSLALPGGSQGVPRPAEQHGHSSVSWVFLGVSSRRVMPGTPPEEGVQGASDTDT